MTALQRLRDEMAETVRKWQFTQPGTGSVSVSDVVDALVEDWRVEMKMVPSTRERFYVITTPRRPASALEALMDAAQDEREEWLYRRDDDSVPPPPSVTTRDLLDQRTWWLTGDRSAVRLVDMSRDLLDQRTWWLTGDRSAVRLVDMSPEHRVNLLGYLRRRAGNYQFSEWTSGMFDDAPDEVANSAIAESPLRWLGRQELVRQLKKLIRRDRRRGEVVAYDYDGPAVDEGRLIAHERFPDE